MTLPHITYDNVLMESFLFIKESDNAGIALANKSNAASKTVQIAGRLRTLPRRFRFSYKPASVKFSAAKHFLGARALNMYNLLINFICLYFKSSDWYLLSGKTSSAENMQFERILSAVGQVLCLRI